MAVNSGCGIQAGGYTHLIWFLIWCFLPQQNRSKPEEAAGLKADCLKNLLVWISYISMDPKAANEPMRPHSFQMAKNRQKIEYATSSVERDILRLSRYEMLLSIVRVKLYQDWFGRIIWDISPNASCFPHPKKRTKINNVLLAKYSQPLPEYCWKCWRSED